MPVTLRHKVTQSKLNHFSITNRAHLENAQTVKNPDTLSENLTLPASTKSPRDRLSRVLVMAPLHAFATVLPLARRGWQGYKLALNSKRSVATRRAGSLVFDMTWQAAVLLIPAVTGKGSRQRKAARRLYRALPVRRLY